MKKGVLTSLILLSMINSVSAQFYGGYGRFSIRDFFYRTDPDTIVLGALFFIFFPLIFYALGRVFKDQYGEPNRPIAGVVSLATSFLIIYGIHQSRFDVGNFFFRFGISSDFIYGILPFFVLGAAILIGWKLGFGWLLMITGAFITLVTVFTDAIYEKGIAMVIGIGLFLVGLYIRSRTTRRLTSTSGKWAGRQAWEGAKWGSRHARSGLSNLDRWESKMEEKARLRRNQKLREKEQKRIEEEHFRQRTEAQKKQGREEAERLRREREFLEERRRRLGK